MMCLEKLLQHSLDQPIFILFQAAQSSAASASSSRQRQDLKSEPKSVANPFQQAKNTAQPFRRTVSSTSGDNAKQVMIFIIFFTISNVITNLLLVAANKYFKKHPERFYEGSLNLPIKMCDALSRKTHDLF